MNQMRADIARLQDEVAVLRRRDSTSQQTERDQGLAMPSPQVAGPSANRLPIPSLPIGANHYQQQPQVRAGAVQSPVRGRTTTAPYVAYTAPTTAWPANHSSAMALLPGANHNHHPAVAAVPPAFASTTGYQPLPSYYVPPRANHLGSPYAVGPGTPYVAIPAPQESLADLDPPGQPVIVPAAPRVLPESLTRPTMTYPISHERPTASAIRIVPTSSAMGLAAAFPLGIPSLSATSALPTSLLPPHLDLAAAAPVLAPPAPTATLAPATGATGLQLSPASRYHVLLGSPPAGGSATISPTQPMLTGVLWGAPRSGSAAAGTTFLAHGPQQGLGPASTGSPHGSSGVQLYQHQAPHHSSLIGHGNGLTLFSGAGGSGGGEVGDRNESRRPSLGQQSVTDWQALLEDSTRFSPSATPVSLGDGTPSVASFSHVRMPTD